HSVAGWRWATRPTSSLPTNERRRPMALDEAARVVAEQLNGRTVATAESCTAGRLGSSLAAVENAVDFYRGTLVAYQEEIKRSLLAVRADSVFSQEAAEQMALGVCELLGADAAVATT